MSQAMRKRIHLIYGIALSAITVIAGICLILSCYRIYTTGIQSDYDQIYSRAIVAEAFSPIAIPVYLCLALTIGSFILHLALPLEQKKSAPEKNRQLILSRLQAKTDLQQCDAGLQNAIAAQQELRKLSIGISTAVSLVCAVIFLVYALNGSNWAPVHEVTSSMIASMRLFLPCTIIPLACFIAAAYLSRRSLDKEIELMRTAAQQAPVKPAAPAQKPVKSNCRISTQMVRNVLLAAAIIFILIGIFTDGVEGAVAKAIAICTECVGLG